MKIQHSTIRATCVALIFIFFSISFINAQWKWHGHPQIGFIYDFEIDQEKIFLLRTQHEGNNVLTESIIKMDLEGFVLKEDSLILQIGHNSVKSGLTILEEQIILNNYDLSKPVSEQNQIKYILNKNDFVLNKTIEVSNQKSVYWSNIQTVPNVLLNKEVVFGTHYRYDDLNADQGELLFQFWSPSLGLEQEYRYQIEDKEGNSFPTPVDLIKTNFGYIGAAFYKSKSRFFVFPGRNDTVFANRSHLYCFDQGGNLFDIKELGEGLYQERPQFYFNVNQVISAPDGYFVVGSLEIGKTLVYMKLNQNLGLEWIHDLWSQDTTALAFFDMIQAKSILSQDGHIYTVGWQNVKGAPGGDPRGSQSHKYLIKFDPIEKQIEWHSRLDEHYGQLWDIEESADGRKFVSGTWDREGDLIPRLQGLEFDSWFIAEVDSLGRIEPIVSIGEEVNNEPWVVFPNPVNNVLHIQANIQNRQTQWRAYDLQGRIYWESQGIVNTVDISVWPDGVYMIQRQQGANMSTKRVIKMN